jgi:hypothetical protein
MGLRYENLDVETRRLMVEEINLDANGDGLYVSSYLNDAGAASWVDLTLEAAASGTDDSLASTLSQRKLLKTHTERRKPKGGYTTVAVPYTAAQTLSEAQFNMYYMRALARRVIEGGGNLLVVYRAKAVENPRLESQRMVGQTIDSHLVLSELRRTKGVNPDINIPLPNSGLTLRLS